MCVQFGSNDNHPICSNGKTRWLGGSGPTSQSQLATREAQLVSRVETRNTWGTLYYVPFDTLQWETYAYSLCPEHGLPIVSASRRGALKTDS